MMKYNRILYFSLLFLSLVFVYFYGGRVPYTLFYLMLFLPLFSFLYTLIIFIRFKYIQEIDNKFAVKGSKVNFIFSISNEDVFLYPYISVTFCGSETIFAEQFKTRNFSIRPFDRKSFEIELYCKYRGTYEIGLSSIVFKDFLGIIKLSYKIFEPKSVTVYPRVVFLDKFKLNTDFMSESYSILNTEYEDMSTISDVRKYAYGDSLKRIHWKLTAKINNLMVKKYQNTSLTSAIIMLDLKENSFSLEENTIIEDKIIEACLSVMHYCLSNWLPINLVYYSDGIISVKADNPLMFDDIYNILAKIKFKGSIDIEDILDVYTDEILNKNDMLIFTSNLTYSLYNQIYKTGISGYNVSLIYISPEEITGVKNDDSENILSYLPEINVNAYKVSLDSEIKPVLERY